MSYVTLWAMWVSESRVVEGRGEARRNENGIRLSGVGQKRARVQPF